MSELEAYLHGLVERKKRGKTAPLSCNIFHLFLIKLRSLLVVVATAYFLAGCAVAPTYVASAKSPAEGATVAGMMELVPFFKVVITGVDGYVRRGMDAGLPNPMLVDPGLRTLQVQCVYFGYFVLVYSGQVTFDLVAELKAGHSYELRGERSEQLVTAWLEDAVTREPVSERVSKEASVMPILGGVGNNF